MRKEITIEQAITIAGQHQQAGRLGDAEALYRQIIALQPDHVHAWHLLGIVLAAGHKFDEAIDAYHQALRQKPDYPNALINLGNALKDKGQIEQAINAYRRALILQPNIAEGHYNLGTALSAGSQLDQAIEAYREAIRLKPAFAPAHNNLANALKSSGRIDEAIAAYAEALRLHPDYPDALNNFGVLLLEQGRVEEAIAAHTQSLMLKPDFAEAHYNLGIAVERKGHHAEAIEAYRQAIALNPNYAEAHYNLGHTLAEGGRFKEAIAPYVDAIRLKPQWPEPHWNLALTLLLLGDYERGFAEYEWRWRQKEFLPSVRKFSQPMWEGRELNGKILLLHAEQGLGDTIQFIRYAPLIAARGGKVILECAPHLARLLRSVPALSQIVTAHPLPAFDVHCPMLSLPLMFGTRPETIPADIPYLAADPELIAHWGRKLEPRRDELRLGLVWSGAPGHRDDQNRSIQLSQLAPLAGIAGVTFYSLQKGPASTQAANPPAGMQFHDLTADIADLADTAALIAQLDLVIAVDTSVVHLAGALGKPVWVLLAFYPDWRWMLKRQDSPWYPTARLFRQRSRGNWAEVISRVVDALAEMRSGTK